VSGGVRAEADTKVVASKEDDSSFHYRVMEAIRNYTQHHAFPVHAAPVRGPK
jgi:hypothetical protein